MLVDGSDATRKMVGQLLRKQLEGVDIQCFHSAREALATLTLEHFDLISTALVLPDMDGMVFTEALRGVNGHETTPVIVISGDAAGRLDEQQSDITAFFDKSRGIKALVDFIADHLPAADGGQAPAPPLPENPRVLYVEDSVAAAKTVKRLLDAQGITADHVMTAEEALERLDAGEAYDLLITDQFLPGRLSGTDLVRRIRHGLHLGPDLLPVLVITLEGSSEADYRRLLEGGACDYITKPLAEGLLQDKLLALLATRA